MRDGEDGVPSSGERLAAAASADWSAAGGGGGGAPEAYCTAAVAYGTCCV